MAKVSSHLAKPLRNGDVWGGVNCVSWFDPTRALICTRCWHALSALSPEDGVEMWMRSSWLEASFFHALNPAMANLPELPGCEFVYHQTFVGRKREESATTWTANRPAVLVRLKRYCARHGLRMETDRKDTDPSRVYITISTKRGNEGLE